MNPKFNRKVILSKTPLTTAFRFKDVFQIYPCEVDGAPQSDRCDDIPLVIEYWYDLDDSPKVSEDFKEIEGFASEAANQINRLKRLTNILSATTNHRIFDYSSTSMKWGFVFPEVKELETEEGKKKVDGASSQVIVTMYQFPAKAGFRDIKRFSEVKYTNPDFAPSPNYYIMDPTEGRNKSIVFPHIIEKVLDKYFSLHGDAKKIVDTVAHLICNGIDLEREMKSLSFLSFVSSIETLVNFEYASQNKEIEFECNDCQTIRKSPFVCHKCGRPIWGISAKFKTFLKTYISSGEGAKKKYSRIYNLRSKIVHNGSLLLGDEELNWEKSKEQDSEWMTHFEVKQLARLSLVNWLLLGPGKQPVQ